MRANGSHHKSPSNFAFLNSVCNSDGGERVEGEGQMRWQSKLIVPTGILWWGWGSLGSRLVLEHIRSYFSSIRTHAHPESQANYKLPSSVCWSTFTVSQDCVFWLLLLWFGNLNKTVDLSSWYVMLIVLEKVFQSLQQTGFHEAEEKSWPLWSMRVSVSMYSFFLERNPDVKNEANRQLLFFLTGACAHGLAKMSAKDGSSGHSPGPQVLRHMRKTMKKNHIWLC